MTDSAVGVSTDPVISPGPTPSDPPLVQLLTPEGERVEHPDYAVDLTDDELRGALPRPRPGPPGRRRGDRAAAAGRAGHLGQRCSARRPPRSAPAGRCAAGRLAFPTYREHGVAWCRGVDPLQPARPVPRRQPRRLGPERAQLPPLHDRHRRADACTRPATRWACSSDGAESARHRLLRRRRDQPGRRQRGVHLRQRLQRAGRLLLPEQPVGDLRAARAADPHPALPAGRRLRLPRRPGRRQRRARRATR